MNIEGKDVIVPSIITQVGYYPVLVETKSRVLFNRVNQKGIIYLTQIFSDARQKEYQLIKAKKIVPDYFFIIFILYLYLFYLYLFHLY